MVELAALALHTGLHEWGREPVIATRTIAADAATLQRLVADPASQWRLVAGLHPLLAARARPARSCHPRFVHAAVSFGHYDVLWITWILTPRRGTTEVDLAAQIESRSILARLIWLLGGRQALRHHLEVTLGTLASLALRAAEDLDDIERDAGLPATIPTHGAG
jgi:hypothetical protein